MKFDGQVKCRVSAEEAECDDRTESHQTKVLRRRRRSRSPTLLNDRALSLFDAHDIPLSRMFTDRSTKSCGAHDRHPYELLFFDPRYPHNPRLFF